MLPLSFKEYLSAFPDKKENKDRAFLEYLKNGGMPGNISILETNLLGKKANSDMGHLLENIVCLELLRRGYKVYVGKVDDYEIDFVAENRDGIKYYQVALSVRDEKVLERELRALEKTGDYYPKYLLTLDMDLETDYNGIAKKNVVDWLLSDSND